MASLNESMNNPSDPERFGDADQRISRKGFLQAAGIMAVGMAGGLSAACQSNGQAPSYPVPTTGTYKAPGGQSVPTSPPYSPPAEVPEDVTKPIELEAWKSDADRKSPPCLTRCRPISGLATPLSGWGTCRWKKFCQPWLPVKSQRLLLW
ncbi:hypothetical protein [Spirosoma sp. KUDC1026]|uniref:hypothetical protein n=1 Tax=Spirosoma sp. KUDC1026 TaxID=2745947 RepID=UPI00293C0DF1|nr:hypothetical protein [Spirosoma sp. KUDC1026]